MIGYLLVAGGAAVGAPLRYLADRLVQGRHHAMFPWGTLIVNIIGSGIFGALTAAMLAGVPSPLELALGTGFCGAFTTFSTFSYETVRLAQLNVRWPAVANVAGSIIAGILAAGIGYQVTAMTLGYQG